MPAEFLPKSEANWERPVNRNRSRERTTKLGRFINRLREITSRESGPKKPIDYTDVTPVEPQKEVIPPAVINTASVEQGNVGFHSEEMQLKPEHNALAIINRIENERRVAAEQAHAPRHAAYEAPQPPTETRSERIQREELQNQQTQIIPKSDIVAAEAAGPQMHAEQTLTAPFKQEAAPTHVSGSEIIGSPAWHAQQGIEETENRQRTANGVIGESEFPVFRGNLHDITPRHTTDEAAPDDNEHLSRAA